MAGVPGRSGTKKGHKPTEEHRAALQANASRARGRWANTEERAQIDAAKAIFRSLTPEAARFCERLMNGEEEGATLDIRLRAAENIMDRGGLSRRTESEVETRFPVIVFDGVKPWPDQVSGDA